MKVKVIVFFCFLGAVIGTLAALAATPLPAPVPHAGRCTVTSRAEMAQLGIPGVLVSCRWQGEDVTGDGEPETVELTLLLRRGRVDCRHSSYAVLDLTRTRHQAIAVAPACR